MNKVTRRDSRRDAEAIELAQELRETEAWFHSERFRHITRLHTPYEVVVLRGNLRIDRALCALIRGETATGTGTMQLVATLQSGFEASLADWQIFAG